MGRRLKGECGISLVLVLFFWHSLSSLMMLPLSGFQEIVPLQLKN
jgi:hypothetical protein